MKYERDENIFEEKESSKFYSNIINQYLAQDIDYFLIYLKNNERLIDFLKTYSKMKYLVNPEEIEDAILEMKIINKYSFQNKSEDFDKKILEGTLVRYYIGEACNDDLFFLNATDVELFEGYNNTKLLEKYIEEVLLKYISPIINRLYPFSNWITGLDDFNKQSMLKKFYKDTSINTFKKAVEEFKDEKNSFAKDFLDKELHNTFYSNCHQIEDQIDFWNNILFKGNENIFTKSRYKQGAQNFWVPLLFKSNINICNKPTAKLLTSALKAYMMFYSLRNTILFHNKSNLIVANKFEFISKISPDLDAIHKITRLNKSEFKYIFFALLRLNCFAEDKEINFLMMRLGGFHKETYQNTEKYLLETVNKDYINFQEHYKSKSFLISSEE